MKYSIVIPTYNHCNDLLKPCLESLFRTTDIYDVELIISANGCTDDTFAYLGSLKEKFNYLGLANNLKIAWDPNPIGYARATNAGVELATTDLIVLLNNDVLMLPQTRNRWLELLAAQIAYPNCGISCVIKGPSEPAGRDFAVFFCVMVHRKVFNKIGLLSLDYGVGGGEDTEFCIEAENAGFEVREAVVKVWHPETNLFVGDFPIYHKGEGTVHDSSLVPDWSNIFLRNSLTLAKKYNPRWYQWRLSNYWERAVFFKGDQVYPREVTRYSWAAAHMVGKKVFELGCSSGYGVQFLPHDVTYTGLDYDELIIKTAREQGWGDNTTFVHSAINDFKLDFYDTIIAFEVIEHLDNGLEVVKRLQNHCNCLLMTVPMNEAEGQWGPHHKLHNLNESFFPGFEFRYIDTNGTITDEPAAITEANQLNLLVMKWVKDSSFVGNPIYNTGDYAKDLSWLSEKHLSMYNEVIKSNSYHLTSTDLVNRSIIDIGANVGTFSILSAYLGANRIICVEPVTPTFNALSENITRSGFTNIVCKQNIVSNVAGTVIDISIKEDSGHNSLYNINGESEKVESITLSQLIKEIDSDNIILKLDCEGAEYDILMNASEEDMAKVSAVYMEVHYDLHPTYKGYDIIKNKLLSFGFNAVIEDQIFQFYFGKIDSELPFKNCLFKK